MKKIIFCFVICQFFMLNACANRSKNVPVDDKVIKTLIFTSTETKHPTPTSTLVPSTSFPLVRSRSWKTIWLNDFPNNGRLLAIRQGLENEYWFLSDNTLVLFSKQGKTKTFNLQEILECFDCQNILNGTLVIGQTNDVWIGLSSGLLVVHNNGDWERFLTQDIIQVKSNSTEVRALLSDQEGNIWVSSTNMLCSFNNASWQCSSLDNLIENYYAENAHNYLDEIISATLGKDEEIWFGTKEGKIILFDDEKFHIDTLPKDNYLHNIGDMAFDTTSDTIWAVSLDIPDCKEGLLTETSGVIFKESKNEWYSFNLSLFADKDEHLCYYPLRSITVTPDGTVWLGMMYRHGLVYYNGANWSTINGEMLPFFCSSCPRHSDESLCGLHDCYIVDLLVTHDGRLLVANRFGVFEYLDASLTN